MSAMIISFDDEPDVVQEFTNNRRLLREALDRIEPTAKPTNIRGALELAGGFANPERVSIEEGGVEVDATDAGAGRALHLQRRALRRRRGFLARQSATPSILPIGTFEANNLAITAFNARRNDSRPEERQAFVQVANFSDAAQTAGVSCCSTASCSTPPK